MAQPYDPTNIFARILRKEIPCTTLYEDDFALAFHDINPHALVHILVIPQGAYTCFNDFMKKASPLEIIGFFKVVQLMAEKAGVEASGYRLITNIGANGGQEVLHFHVHLLGGQPLKPIILSCK